MIRSSTFFSVSPFSYPKTVSFALIGSATSILVVTPVQSKNWLILLEVYVIVLVPLIRVPESGNPIVESTAIVSPPISMGIFGYPHREGARITLEVLLNHLDGEEDPGFREFVLVIKERNFINNMRTVYRESEDQLPGVDTTSM